MKISRNGADESIKRLIPYLLTIGLISINLIVISNLPAEASYTGTLQNFAAESGSVTLTPPAGSKFTSVLFASYGTPNTTTYTQGSCHAANSASIVASAFIGQTTSVTINATNAVFGDPCVGTGKTLAIKIAYTTILTNSVAPAITGTLSAGQVLTTSNGTWNVTPDSYTYQWQSAASSGGTYSNISGATSNTYTLTNSEIGKYIKVQVTASNDAGGVLAESPATGSSISATTSTTLSITGSPTVTDYRFARAISIGVSVNGKVTLTANGKVISGCKNKLTSGLSFVCNWKPSTRGYVNLVATYTPISAGYLSSTSAPYRIFVTNRTGTR